jgi:hypothetical protein
MDPEPSVGNNTPPTSLTDPPNENLTRDASDGPAQKTSVLKATAERADPVPNKCFIICITPLLLKIRTLKAQMVE